MTHTSTEQERQAPIKIHPGDDMHLTLLMAPHNLNLVTGQDRQHLLAFGRAAFEAGQYATKDNMLLAVMAENEQLKAQLAAAQQGVHPFGYVNTQTGQFFKDVEPCRKNNEGHWRTVYANHAAQELDAETQRNADIGAAIQRACKELPAGAEIQIYLERGAGAVHMTDWDGNEFDHFDEDHEDFACRINAATDGAIAAEQVAAHVKQGGAAS